MNIAPDCIPCIINNYIKLTNNGDLSEELKEMIVIKNDAKGFTKAINNFVKDKRKITIKNDVNFLKTQMIGTTMQYVVNNFLMSKNKV